MSEKEKIILPQKYYLDYYRYIIDFVLERYEGLMSEKELEYIDDFQSLSEEAQCLYLRMTTRRGFFFRENKLNYEEVPNTAETLEELAESGFVKMLSRDHVDYAAELYPILSKPELIQLIKSQDAYESYLAKFRKEELCGWILEELSFDRLVDEITKNQIIVEEGKLEEEEFVRFLFFGNLYGSITDFVVRDVGHRKYEQFDEKAFSSYFRSRAEIDDKLFVARTSREMSILLDHIDGLTVYHWFVDRTSHIEELTERALRGWDRQCIKLGRQLEREKEFEKALEIYRKAEEHPSRQRQLMVLKKMGKMEEALALCEVIRDKPYNADEYYYSIDFINREEKKGKRSSNSTTSKLKESDGIEISKDWQYKVEEGALNYFLDRKWKGHFAENHLWKSLFGLVLWPVLFDGDSAAIHQPLQSLPSDLRSKNFLEKRRNAIEERLKLLDKSRTFKKEIERLFEEKKGINTTLVYWDENLLKMIFALRRKAGAEALKAVIRKMAENFRSNSKGFPDLFIYNRKDFAFLEVKSPNDSLSAQQLFWIDFLEQQNIPARVLKVAWIETES